jgi:hypothetical protein
MKPIKSLVIIPILFFLSFKLSAQDRKFLNPQLKFSAEYDIPSQLKNSTEKFSMAKSQLGFVYPLLSRRYGLTNNLDYKSMVVLANLNAGYALPMFTFIDTQHQLVTGSVGGSFIFNSGNKNTWLGGVNAGIAEDIESLDSYEMRFTGHFLFKHKTSGNFSYHAGVVYTYVYGRGMPLPVLGGILRIGDKSKLKFTLPLSITYMIKTNELSMLSVFVQPDGNAYNFSTKSDTFFYGRNNEILKLRLKNFKAGASYTTGKSERFQFAPEAGFLFNRSIMFTEGSYTSKEDLFSNNVKPAPYVKIFLRILIGSLKWKRTGDNFLLNDERLDYYDLDDPTKL